MASRKRKDVLKVRHWEDRDLENGARLVVREVLEGETELVTAQLMLTIILNEAARRGGEEELEI